MSEVYPSCSKKEDGGWMVQESEEGRRGACLLEHRKLNSKKYVLVSVSNCKGDPTNNIPSRKKNGWCDLVVHPTQFKNFDPFFCSNGDGEPVNLGHDLCLNY